MAAGVKAENGMGMGTFLPVSLMKKANQQKLINHKRLPAKEAFLIAQRLRSGHFFHQVHGDEHLLIVGKFEFFQL